MGMKKLEAAMLAELREVTALPSLRHKDIMEWGTGDIKPLAGETVVRLPKLLVYVAYVAPAPKKGRVKATMPATAPGSETPA